jgi:TPR repeat protein
MYSSGRGVARDSVRSYMWMLLAADAGDETASANKSIVARRLTPAEIGSALDLSRQWQMTHAPHAGAYRSGH